MVNGIEILEKLVTDRLSVSLILIRIFFSFLRSFLSGRSFLHVLDYLGLRNGFI